ncbi:hypothetical protein JCM19047_3311 [Bacillus sp. JCM 19047]|nr:hypothetical protein JCM19047_3311 [Bacillus sp. JCM 19047]
MTDNGMYSKQYGTNRYMLYKVKNNAFVMVSMIKVIMKYAGVLDTTDLKGGKWR